MIDGEEKKEEEEGGEKGEEREGGEEGGAVLELWQRNVVVKADYISLSLRGSKKGNFFVFVFSRREINFFFFFFFFFCRN